MTREELLERVLVLAGEVCNAATRSITPPMIYDLIEHLETALGEYDLECGAADEHTCEGCCHSDMPGVRPDATNHIGLRLPEGAVIVERCDTCERFATDAAAAMAYGAHAQTLTSSTGVRGPDRSITICYPDPR